MVKRKLAPGAASVPALSPDQIDHSILIVRGHKVLLDEQLAGFYGVPTKALVQAVKRNIERFPADFAFQLTGDEWSVLTSQVSVSNLRSHSVTSSSASHGGRRPCATSLKGLWMSRGSWCVFFA
jgi:hypothetical protein